ncbi:carbohydrate ABC transporter permease [Halalkalibacterium halodurans]|uniref:carbohydrate ABC transporter permease n=1 Tax=Halalkalibacterium halodurans TaxID=86665 RepID=UPI002AAA2078|nr:carbohydrate ABC transporter permease [Halalkalibacterium halodurans]MDY7222668.1 carbohydrate ABC transporter permease [Halalkalibacterium halodurans]MDY7241889.1 carbohydrate ABC transporter permease [Halalkalibacterium halodurans]
MIKLKYQLISTLKYLSLIAGFLVTLIPILVVLFASFKTPTEYATTNALTPPENWFNFTNYGRAFFEGKMLLGFFNTAIILIVSVVFAILIGTMIAYVLNRFTFRGSKMMLGLFLLATLIPAITTQVATFQIISELGLFNTRWAAIVLFSSTDIIAVYIFLQFLERVPVSLDESAMLDGASYFTIYRKIILPQLKPAMATVFIIKGVAIYNDFYIPFLYMPKPELQVVSTALFKFQGPYGSQWEVICAGIIIVIIPTLIIFIALQRYIYNGFTEGSVK